MGAIRRGEEVGVDVGDFNDGIAHSLPSFRSFGGGLILRVAIIHYKKNMHGYNEIVACPKASRSPAYIGGPN